MCCDFDIHLSTGGTIKRVEVQKGFYVVTRIVLAFYFPLCFTAAYHAAHNFNLTTIAAVIALVSSLNHSPFFHE
jgi:hypothetical protein